MNGVASQKLKLAFNRGFAPQIISRDFFRSDQQRIPSSPRREILDYPDRPLKFLYCVFALRVQTNISLPSVIINMSILDSRKKTTDKFQTMPEMTANRTTARKRMFIRNLIALVIDSIEEAFTLPQDFVQGPQ